ncbi:MAG: ABC transporter substrate-binding protein [Acidimicrobiales bacterium]
MPVPNRSPLPLPRSGRHLLLGLLALVTVTGLVAAGCGSSNSSSGSGTATGSAAGSGKVVPLTIYAAEGYDVAEGKAFQKATGIPTTVDDNSTGPLTTKIQAEGKNPHWDLFWVDGATVFAGLDQLHLLLKGWEPSAIGNYNAVGKSLIPADKSYIPTGVTMAAALVYNTKLVTSPPTAWAQLTEPQWKGAVGMNDPSVSGPTYPYVAGIMQQLGGVAQGEAFFAKLHANGLHVYQTNTNTLQALETGVIKLATVQSSAGIGAAISNKELKVEYLKYETVLPSCLGISAYVSKQAQAEAKRFVEFVLSPAGQKVMQSGDPTGDSLFFPLVNGENPLPAVGTPLASIPTQNLNPYTWGPRENGLNSWFTTHIIQ